MYFLWEPMTHITFFLSGAAILGLSIAIYKREQAIRGLNAVAKFFESSDSCIPPEAAIPELSELDNDIKMLIAEDERMNILQQSKYDTSVRTSEENARDFVPQLRRTKSETCSANMPENFATPNRKCRFESSIPTKDNSTISDADEIISRVSEAFADLNEFEDFEESPTGTKNTSTSRKNSSYMSEHIEEELPELDFSPISRQMEKPEAKSVEEMQDLLLAQKLINEDWDKYVKLNGMENTCAENEKSKCNEECLDRLKRRAEVPRNDSCSSLSHKAKRRAESLSPLTQRRQTHTNLQEDGNKLRHTSSVGSKLNLIESDASKTINVKY